MKNENPIDVTSIPGYGMDADPENEPTYPMKHWTGDDHKRTNYERSSQQMQTVEILQSNERPSLSAVFGTSVPPSGLSGMIRRYAFKHSEDRYRHWLPLILADRINTCEGIIEDIKSGSLPNLFKERGLKVEIKHKPVKFFANIFVCALAATATATYLLKKGR